MKTAGPAFFVVFLSSLLLVVSCGKKGPPLAPMNMAPEAPKTVTARRLGDTVYIQMTVPDHSISGRGSFSVDHIDVYAATIPDGVDRSSPAPATPNSLTACRRPIFVIRKPKP